eukprot:148884_1
MDGIFKMTDDYFEATFKRFAKIEGLPRARLAAHFLGTNGAEMVISKMKQNNIELHKEFTSWSSRNWWELIQANSSVITEAAWIEWKTRAHEERFIHGSVAVTQKAVVVGKGIINHLNKQNFWKQIEYFQSEPSLSTVLNKFIRGQVADYVDSHLQESGSGRRLLSIADEYNFWGRKFTFNPSWDKIPIIRNMMERNKDNPPIILWDHNMNVPIDFRFVLEKDKMHNTVITLRRGKLVDHTLDVVKLSDITEHNGFLDYLLKHHSKETPCYTIYYSQDWPHWRSKQLFFVLHHILLMVERSDNIKALIDLEHILTRPFARHYVFQLGDVERYYTMKYHPIMYAPKYTHIHHEYFIKTWGELGTPLVVEKIKERIKWLNSTQCNNEMNRLLNQHNKTMYNTFQQYSHTFKEIETECGQLIQDTKFIFFEHQILTNSYNGYYYDFKKRQFVTIDDRKMDYKIIAYTSVLDGGTKYSVFRKGEANPIFDGKGVIKHDKSLIHSKQYYLYQGLEQKIFEYIDKQSKSE